MDMKKRILIVEDEPLNLKLLKTILARTGFDIVTAGDGEAALEVVARESIDLIFMDALMPGISGFETCRRLKSSEQYKHIPVIILTGLSASDRERLSREACADDWLEKPFSRDSIMEKLYTYLNKMALQKDASILKIRSP